MNDNIKPKYPIVLVHGIIAHDRRSIINFWGRIPKALTKMGIKVFFGNTDAWGDFESNSLILKKTIEDILQETKSEKVNIIAHSKGGLDSRYLIWKHDFGGKIASLSTICTPHHGAELADLIYEKKIVHRKYFKKLLSVFGRFYGDAYPDLFNVNYQLTTANMKEFNKKVTMDSRVFYQCFYTTMAHALDDLMFFYSYLQIKKISGKNDGMVSEQSARWGKNIFKIDGGISHVEILDIKKRKISGIRIPDIFVKIVKDLGEKCF